MKTFMLLILAFLSFNTQADLDPLTDEQLDAVWKPALPEWALANPLISGNVKNTEDFLSLMDFVHEIKESAAAGVPTELNAVLNLQDFLNNLTDPNQELDVIGQIIKEVFERAGVRFDLSFENTQIRGNYKFILVDNNGNELMNVDRIDYIGRINIENIGFGDSPATIGNIYITDWDWAPGNFMRIQIRD